MLSRWRSHRVRSTTMSRSRHEPETRSVCCLKCFNDRTLKEMIRENGVRGTCSWCGTQKVKVVGIGELTDPFRQLARQYLPVTGGELLDQLFEDEWKIFAAVHNAESRRELMLAIL